VIKDIDLRFILGDGFVELGLDYRHWVCWDFNCFSLRYGTFTSYSTVTTYWDPISPPTSGRTRTKTFIEVDFSALSFCINITIICSGKYHSPFTLSVPSIYKPRSSRQPYKQQGVYEGSRAMVVRLSVCFPPRRISFWLETMETPTMRPVWSWRQSIVLI
jgi:hypothetical protein